MNAQALEHRYTAGAYSVLATPGWLKSQYNRLVLISHRRHVARLMGMDANTLIFSTDWLAWRQCVESGIACIHFESMLREWPEERGNPDNIHHRNCNWMMVDGQDISEFRGISLGRLFTRDVSLGANAIERLWYALDRALAQFAPTEVLFYDMRAEHDLVNTNIALWIVRSLAKRYGARVVDEQDIPIKGDPGFSEQVDEYATRKPESIWRRMSRKTYSECVDWLFRFRGYSSRQQGKVLLVLNWICARNLIDADDDRRLMPAVFASSSPKRPKDLLWFWQKKAVLVNPPQARLTAADSLRLEAIHKAVIEQARKAERPEDAAKWMFIQTSLLEGGQIESRAKEIISLDMLFTRHQFSRVVIGDATNDYCRTIAETAKQRCVPVDELVNGMFITRQHSTARQALTQNGKPLVERILSWGPLNARWIKASKVEATSATVGYPALDKLRSPITTSQFKRVLVLPIYADGDDAMAFTSNIFGALADVVRALVAFGCDVRVKVHVGPQNFDYYRDVLKQAGLDVPIFKDNLFVKHIEWADFVVGPVNSGAFVETLAAGKPYYPISPTPSQIDPALLPKVKLIQNAADLLTRLKAGDTPDRDEILEDICQFNSIPNSSRRFWEVMAKGISA